MWEMYDIVGGEEYWKADLRGLKGQRMLESIACELFD